MIKLSDLSSIEFNRWNVWIALGISFKRVSTSDSVIWNRLNQSCCCCWSWMMMKLELVHRLADWLLVDCILDLQCNLLAMCFAMLYSALTIYEIFQILQLIQFNLVWNSFGNNLKLTQQQQQIRQTNSLRLKKHFKDFKVYENSNSEFKPNYFKAKFFH